MSLSNNSMPNYWCKWLELFYNKVKNMKTIYMTSDNNTLKKTAVIIEPRKHPLLKYVLYNFMYFLVPKGWKFQIFCGTDNKEWLEQEIEDLKDDINIYQLPYDNLTEPMYNMLLTNGGFWKSIYNNPEYVLIFQTDCILLKDNIDEFLQYDMIGAPWRHSPYKGCNGGFSLRKREAMIDICKKCEYKYENEDGWFSYTNADKLKNPELIEKMKFSMETIWSPSPTGMHASYKFQDHSKLVELLEKMFDITFNEKIQLIKQ